MDRVFKSKIGWWYHLLVWLMISSCVFAVLGQNIGFTIGAVLTTALVLYVFFNTNYTITADGMLILRCGFFPVKK